MRVSVTGTPGCGKTTVAREVAQRLGMEYIDAGAFARKKGLVAGKEGGSLLVDERKLRRALARMDNCVFDWHCAETLGADYVFVHRLHPRTLLARLSERRYKRKKLKENLLAEMLDVCLLSSLAHNPARNVFEIINTDSGKTARRIVRIIKKDDRSKSFGKQSACHFLSPRLLAWWERV